MSARNTPPRLRPLSARRSAILSVLDVGTSKIVCLIARLDPIAASEMLRGRTHSCRILGIGHQRSKGIKAGAVVDLEEAESAIRLAVDAAERMAGVQVESVIVTATGCRLASQLYDAKVAIGGRAVAEGDVHRVLEACASHAAPRGRIVLHSVPTNFGLGEIHNIRDPRGMVGDELRADLNVVSCDAAAVRNLMLAVERCHLSVEAMVASPYAAGLSTLVDDEAELGTALVDICGGTTSIGVFVGGHLAHADAFSMGGNHITMDIARGLNIRLADAERLKTLYGSCLPSASDERESIAVTPVGEDPDRPVYLPKSQLVRIIRPRVEEMLEFTRDRLKQAGFSSLAGHRLILTGGASQLPGLPEEAKRIIGKQARIGRPLGIRGLPESAKSPSFSAAVGLLIYPQMAKIERFRLGRTTPSQPHTGTHGYVARVGQWLRSSF
jgi:cell division protein FtsA